MRLPIKKQSSFSRLKQVIGNLWKKLRPGRKTSIQQEGLYRTCDELPLERFIQCSVHGKYDLLIKHGSYSQADLVEAWSAIQMEYIDRVEEQETLYTIRLAKEISLLHHQISVTETTIYLLGIMYRPELVQCLKDLGYDYDFDPSDPSKYKNALGAVQNRLAPLKLRFQVKSIEFEELNKNKSSGEKPTEKFFKTMLVRLAKFQGVALIRAKDLTTGEYCDLFLEYVNDINQQKKALESHGNKRNY